MALLFENGDRIVFAGDSVTDMGSVQPVADAMFDNLGKGASGAAMQNMNIMLGIDETTGLE